MSSISDYKILGLDIGGTSIRAGVLINGDLLDIQSIPTPADESQEMILSTIIDFIASYLQYNFQAIGIGIPGLIDTQEGVVLNLANIPSFKEVQLKSILEKKFLKPVFINNDANCFALGVSKFGEGRNYNNIVGITLGTGLGTGIIINKQLYCGTVCAAGEWCAVPYLDSTFEDYCSGKFFLNHYNKKARSLAKRAAEGDPIALQAFDEFGGHLGELIKNILYVLAPQAVVLGGSIRKAFPYFEKSMHHRLSTFSYPRVMENFKIIISDLDERAIRGALALVDEKELDLTFSQS
jgi:glucokinase